LVVSAGLVALVAGVVAYIGVALAVTIVSSNRDAKGIAALGGYLTGAFGAPLAAGVFVTRWRGWGRLRAVRFAAVVSLLVHVAQMTTCILGRQCQVPW
jgi:hypothetical protein